MRITFWSLIFVALISGCHSHADDLSPADHRSLQRGDICTLDPTEGILYYEPLVVPCPAVGEPFVTTFGFVGPTDLNMSTPFLGKVTPPFSTFAGVSHSGGTEGIRSGSIRSASCSDQSCNITEFLDKYPNSFFETEVGNDRCPTQLAVDKQCGVGRRPFLSSAEQKVETFVVINDGGCEGNLTIEAGIDTTLSDEGDELWGPPSCFSKLLPLDAPFDNSTHHPAAKEVSICKKDEDGVAYYPSLTIPCPDVGKRVGAIAIFRMPTKMGRFTPNTATQLSISVYHDDEDPVNGIILDVPGYGIDSCEDLVEREIDPDSVFNGEPNDLPCVGTLRSPNKLCSGTSFNANSGKVSQRIFHILNTGGCVGNLHLETSLDDISDELAFSSVCLKEIEQVCQDELANATPILNITAPNYKSDDEPGLFSLSSSVAKSPDTAFASFVVLTVTSLLGIFSFLGA